MNFECRWSRIIENQDVSSRPFASPHAHSLALLAHLVASNRLLAHSLVWKCDRRCPLSRLLRTIVRSFQANMPKDWQSRRVLGWNAHVKCCLTNPYLACTVREQGNNYFLIRRKNFVRLNQNQSYLYGTVDNVSFNSKYIKSNQIKSDAFSSKWVKDNHDKK